MSSFTKKIKNEMDVCKSFRNIKEKFDYPSFSFTNNSEYKCRFTALTLDKKLLFVHDFKPKEKSVIIQIPLQSKGVIGICEPFDDVKIKGSDQITVPLVSVGKLLEFATSYEPTIKDCKIKGIQCYLRFLSNIRTIYPTEEDESASVVNSRFQVINVTHQAINQKDGRIIEIGGGYEGVVEVISSLNGEDSNLLQPFPVELSPGSMTRIIPIPNNREQNGLTFIFSFKKSIDSGYKNFYHFIPRIERSNIYRVFIYVDSDSKNPRFVIDKTPVSGI